MYFMQTIYDKYSIKGERMDFRNAITVMLIIIGFCFQGAFGDDEYTCTEIQDKAASFSRMEAGGTKLLIGGVSLLCAGAIGLGVGIPMLIDYNDAGMIGIIIGEYGLGFGIPLTIAGGVVRKIGRGKRLEYEKRMCIMLKPNGLAMSYSF